MLASVDACWANERLTDSTMKKLILLVALAATASCSGMRQNGDSFTAHGESFNLFGLQIPGNDYDAAWSEVPEGGTIVTIASTPADMHSVLGVLNRILGFSQTQISGTL